MGTSKSTTGMKTPYFHIGAKINDLLKEQRMTRRELGQRIGVSTSNAIHLITRNNVDVQLLQRVGNALRYNFFAHFPIDDGQGNQLKDLQSASEEKDKVIAEQATKIAELEKEIEILKREAEPVKLEMKFLRQGYEDLKEANALLIASIKPALSLRK